jgi:hypothetical protein
VHAWKACVPKGTGGSNPPPSVPQVKPREKAQTHNDSHNGDCVGYCVGYLSFHMADSDAQRWGRLGGHARAMSLSPAERTESARRAAQARWGEGWLLSYEQWKKLGDAGIADLVKAIRKMPGASRSISVDDYKKMSNYQKSLFLHNKGTVQRPTMTREAFEQLSPRLRLEYITGGGKLE